MPDQEQRRYLFVAVDRAMRWVYVEILEDKVGNRRERLSRAPD